jgi:hypothetical protein
MLLIVTKVAKVCSFLSCQYQRQVDWQIQYCAMPPTEVLKKAFGTINVLCYNTTKNMNTKKKSNEG